MKVKGKERVSDGLKFLAQVSGRTINRGRRNIEMFREDNGFDLGLTELKMMGTKPPRTIQSASGNID